MFDFKRFLKVLSREFALYIRPSVAGLLFFPFFTAVMQITKFLFIPSNVPIVYSGDLYWYLLVFNAAIVGTICFKEYDLKASRTEALLLPASDLEKFTVNFVTGFVLSPVVCLTGLYLGLELGHLVNYIRFDNYCLDYQSGFARFKDFGSYRLLYTCASISFLGAALFRKFKVIKTWSIVLSLAIVSMIVTAVAFHNRALVIIDGECVKMTIDIVESVIIVLCIVLSYLKIRKEKV